VRFTIDDLVQLSAQGIALGIMRGLSPRNRVGRVLGIEAEPCATGPAIYVVDFDGTGIFMTETLLDEAGPLDLLADIKES